MEQISSLWVEKYRPNTLDELIGTVENKEKFAEYLKLGMIPNLLLWGIQGTGKTSFARMLVNSLDCDKVVINASDERGIDTIRDKVTPFASIKTFKRLKVCVLEEAENITDDAAKAFKTVLENYSVTTKFILTTNHIDKMYAPILSRLQAFEFKPSSMEDVIARCKYILGQEKVTYTDKDLLAIVKSSYPDMRLTIQNIEKFSINNKLTLSKEYELQERYRDVIIALLKTPKEESINKIRNLLSKLVSIDYVELYRYLFDHVDSFVLNKDNTIDVMLEIQEHLYRSKDALDKNINFIAMCLKVIRINSGGKL